MTRPRNARGRYVRLSTRQRILDCLATRPAAQPKDVAYALGCSNRTAAYHITAIRHEWRAADRRARKC